MPYVAVSQVLLTTTLIGVSLFFVYMAFATSTFHQNIIIRERIKNVAFLIANEVYQTIIITQSPDLKNDTLIVKVLLSPPKTISKYTYRIYLEQINQPMRAIRVSVECIGASLRGESMFPIGKHVILMDGGPVQSTQDIRLTCHRVTLPNNTRVIYVSIEGD